SLHNQQLTSALEWRNWQTRETQNLVSQKDVGVQVPPPAPTNSLPSLDPVFDRRKSGISTPCLGAPDDSEGLGGGRGKWPPRRPAGEFEAPGRCVSCPQAPRSTIRA